MASENEAAREALAETVKELVDRHGGVRAVARRLGKVETYASQVSRWQRGSDVTLSALSLLATGLNEKVTVTFSPGGHIAAQTEEAAPPWAERLAQRIVDEVQINRQTIREAIVGEEDGETDLVEIVKEELRPLFQELAVLFRAEVQQLLDARLGGTDSD